MELKDIMNLGKSFLEAYLERALTLARKGEVHYQRFVETYDFLAEMLPFPMPKLGKDEPYEPYEPPPAPSFRSPAPKPPEPAKVAAAEPVKPKAKPKPAKKAEEAAPTPKKTKPAPKTAKPAPKKAKPAPTAKKAAEKPKPPAKPAAVKELHSRNVLRRERKDDLQKICRREGVPYQQSDTKTVLINRILEHQGPASA